MDTLSARHRASNVLALSIYDNYIPGFSFINYLFHRKHVKLDIFKLKYKFLIIFTSIAA